MRRGRRVLGGRPAAARRASSAWRASQAVRMRWLRTASRQAGRRGAGGGPLSRGPPGAVGLGGVVVFLPGFGGYVRGDGDGLLLAAGGRVLGRGEDLGPAAV